ncbi:MAG: CHASE2 domain-containing protein [Pseudomonadota bacterium]
MLWLPLAALAAGLCLALTPLNGLLSRPLTDWQQRLLAPAQAPAGVLVIDIDDAALAALRPQLGHWPYARDVYALVVDQLRDAGARAVVLDLLLTDPRPGDAALARALARPGAPVVLAAAGLQPLQASALAAQPAGPAPPAQAWQAFVLPAASVWPAADRIPPLGVMTTPLDDDGLLRGLPLWHGAGDQRLPTQALAVWQALAPPGSSLPPWPVDAAGRVAPIWAAPAAQLPVLGFAQVVQVALGQQPVDGLARAVRGQVVFIGSSATFADPVMTVHGQTQGTVVLAQTYAALRDGALLHPGAVWAQALLLALALLPALATAWRGRADARTDAAAAGLALLALLAAGLVLAAGLHMPLPWAAPLTTLATGLLLSWLLHQRWLAQTHQRLAIAHAQAAAANQAKTDFLANVSHEIRTPMNALLGVSELLADTPLTPVQQRHVQVFREAGLTLQALIDDLLDIAKIEAGRLDLHDAPFSLRDLLQALLDLHRPRAQQKGLQLTLVLAPDLPDGVRGDAQRLAQALGNLLANAIKFTASGQVGLAARLAPEAGPHAVCLEVSDTGLGIAPSKLDAIFDPFVQADGSVTRLHGGTGLGLSITRSIARLMGGDVAVRSQPALGSVFSLTVPLPPTAWPAPPLAAPVAVEPAAPDRPAPGTGPRVLLAEDNPINVHVFQSMLAPHCAVLDVAANGPMALELACRHVHDLVFMDWQMPGMDGLAVTRALRQHEAAHGLPRLPVVALTANAYGVDQALSSAAGCDGHIAKPASKAMLLAAVARHAPAAHRPPALPMVGSTWPAVADATAQAALLASPQIATETTPTAAATADAAASPLDTAAALARLGDDQALLRRVQDHAAVFILRWQQAFDTALAQGDRGRAMRLVHDLRSIAASIGADALAAAAAQVEAGMRAAADGPPAPAAWAGLQRCIGPVIVALTPR